MKENITKRNQGIDFAKFIYIMMMVVYHCFFNAMGVTDGELININRYLILVSGSFPFLAGYLISYHYLYSAKYTDKSVVVRLCFRGIRLIMIYFIVNTLFLIVLKDYIPNGVVDVNVDPLSSILHVKPTRVMFDILVPLGLIMLVGAGSLIAIRILGNTSLIYIQVVLFVVGIIFALATNFIFLACGFIGLAVGFRNSSYYFEKIYRNKLILFLSLMAGLLLALFSENPRDTGIFYMASILTLFFSLVTVGNIIEMSNTWMKNEMSKFAKYSLTIYLAHVPLLVIITTLGVELIRDLSALVLFSLLLFIVLLFSGLMIRFIEYYKARSITFRSLYKLVFE